MAGYDAIELHGAHGYLLAEFMSERFNRRTDEYGGSFERRMRLPRELIGATKASLGEDYPLTIRISGQEFVPGGRSIEESLEVARVLEDAGVSAIHVSAGADDDPEWIADPIYHAQGCKAYLAAEVKRAVSIPVIAVGLLRDPTVAEAVLARGDADFVAIGRGLLVDPDWPSKSVSGRPDTVRKCFACNHCAGQRVDMGLGISCVVNPNVGDPDWARRSMRRPRAKRRVLVIGGGPSGMEAARVAASRGHEVRLIEQQHELGGQLCWHVGFRVKTRSTGSWTT